MAQMPLFPLNVVLFPGMALPIHVFEERYKLMIGRCLEEKLPFGVVLIKSGLEVGGTATPFEVGTAAAIAQAEPLPQGRLNLVAVGLERFRIVRILQEQPYLLAEVESLASIIGDEVQLLETAHKVTALFTEYYCLYLAMSGQWTRTVPSPESPLDLADFVAARLPVENQVKQQLLETLSVARRLEREAEILDEAIPFQTTRLRLAQRERYSGLGVLN